MACELFIFPPPDAAPVLTPQAIITAFTAAGLPCTEEPDDYDHWLVLQGHESALDLTLQDGVVTGANFRYAMQDDEAILQAVIDVFHGLGWQVGDEEGLLETAP